MGILKKLVVGSLAVGAARIVLKNRDRVGKELKNTVKSAKKTLASAKKTYSAAALRGKKAARRTVQKTKKATSAR